MTLDHACARLLSCPRESARQSGGAPHSSWQQAATGLLISKCGMLQSFMDFAGFCVREVVRMLLKFYELYWAFVCFVHSVFPGV